MPHSFNVSAFGPDPGRSDFSILTPFGRNRNSRFPVSAELRRQTAPVHVILAAISVPINLNSNGSIRTATKGGCARAVQTEVARRMMIDPCMVQHGSGCRGHRLLPMVRLAKESRRVGLVTARFMPERRARTERSVGAQQAERGNGSQATR